MKIRELFVNDIFRPIEEVIKVDQADEQIIRDELDEYVVTDSIRQHLWGILEAYSETPNRPHEGIGVWVSGFFGSGKSSFAKNLGLALENRSVLGDGAARLLAQRVGDTKVVHLLNGLAEKVPTEAVIFDVSTDRGIRTGNQSITEIMYRLFLQSMGYAKDLDLSELEITLEEAGRLDGFKARYEKIYNRPWDDAKGLIAIAVQQASRVMHELEPETYPTADSWREAAMTRADVTPGNLAKRGIELTARRCPGKSLVFVVDEVGQFVARDVQKMLDLQAVVQNLGKEGRGKMWLIVTSQEKLTEIVGGLDDKRVELARLMDRFPHQVHLEPADISEVTSKRVLSKNAAADSMLRKLFATHRGRLVGNTRVSAEVKLANLDPDSFVDVYPLLPYQIDLIIQIVSGLRTQGGAGSHVGGANRTIIKLAQQLLVHGQVDLASQDVGALARADQIYDLVSGNITSEVRRKIYDIAEQVDHPFAGPVAKAICLLQYVRSIHRTPENIAAVLHPSVEGDSCLSDIQAALRALESAHMVRQGDDGYRIPTPAEDDWERQRASLQPKPGDIHRIHAEVVAGLWSPKPQHSLDGVRQFRAGLLLGGRPLEDGEVLVHLTLVEAGDDPAEAVEEARRRSRDEAQNAFWVASVDAAIDRETAEVHRSKEILSRKERGAQTKAEGALVSEEKRRLRRHQDEVRRLLKQALLGGTVFFRGNDRSPSDGVGSVARAVSSVLEKALPEAFSRFSEAAARVKKEDLHSILTTENLRGLTSVFTDLRLIRDQGGQTVFNTDVDPLAEVFGKIASRASYGEVANGRYLAEAFDKQPFGWDFDVVRLLVACLLRAGKIEMTSQGGLIETFASTGAREALEKNNLFRQATFRPRQEETDMQDWADAAQAFEVVFGRAMPDISSSGAVADSIRKALDEVEPRIRESYELLLDNRLPGLDGLRAALEQIREIRTVKADHAIQAFNAAHKELKEAIRRGNELAQVLTEPKLEDLRRARWVLGSIWPFLETESDLDEVLRGRAGKLKDLMSKETFFKSLADIDQHTKALEEDYRCRHKDAATARAAVYKDALSVLRSTPGFSEIDKGQQEELERPLAVLAQEEVPETVFIPQMRSDLDACQARLDVAIRRLLEILNGDKVERVEASSFFRGGVETQEQLDEALKGLRDRCLEVIAMGKKLLVQ